MFELSFRCADDELVGPSSEVTSIFNNNAMFGEVNGTGSLFLCYALINHSCSPNVFMALNYGQETTGELRALRNMSTTVQSMKIVKISITVTTKSLK